MWLAQARAITKLANVGSCVIVGRCAGAILKGRKNVLTAFIHAPLDARIARVTKRDGLGEAEAKARIESIDRERAEHSLRFVNTAWDSAETHHLIIDSSLEKPEETAALIADLARGAFPQAPLAPCPKKPARN